MGGGALKGGGGVIKGKEVEICTHREKEREKEKLLS